MRILHSADWHLGRQFHNISLVDDQAHLIDQFVKLANDEQVDAVVIAGDVYDRAIPPTDAVSLLDEVLHKLVVESNIPVVMISGNHDSSDRLGFASGLLAERGFHVYGPLASAVTPLKLQDQFGDVYFCPMPYADPGEVRIHVDDDEIRSHDMAVERLTRLMNAQVPDGARSVGIAHCWVTGGTASESERPLTIGGTGEVAAKTFSSFNYTALGHLHRPQTAGSKSIHYSGSLLKYSFSEADHTKSVNIVEIGKDGKASVEKVALSVRRDVRIIEGDLDSILNRKNDKQSADDYVLIRLSDHKAILDAMGKIRQVYPNALHIERPGMLIGEEKQRSGGDFLKRDEVDLFKDFHQEVTGLELEAESESSFAATLTEIRAADREAQQ
jgi:exonuclease SbcD